MLLLTACAPSCARQDPRPPPDLDAISLALSTTATIAGAIAADVDDPAACIALSGVRDAATAAAEGVARRGAAMPGLTLDVSNCGPLPPAAKVPGYALAIVDGVGIVASHVLSRSDLPCQDRSLASAAVAYTQGATAAVLDEVAAPDGVVVVPGVLVEPCDTNP
jgi:hypothetical protein